MYLVSYITIVILPSNMIQVSHEKRVEWQKGHKERINLSTNEAKRRISFITFKCVKSFIFVQKFGILTKSGKSSNLNFGAKIQ